MSDLKNNFGNNDGNENDAADIARIDIEKIIENSAQVNNSREINDYEHPPVYEYDKNSGGERRILRLDNSQDSAEPLAENTTAQQDKLPEEKTAPEMKKKRSFLKQFIPLKGDTACEKVRKLVLTASIITMVLCVGILADKYAIEPIIESIHNNRISQMKTSENDTDVFSSYPNVDFPSGINPAFAGLYASNSDFAGWLKISGLDIETAIVQAENNEKYLKRNFYGSESKYGCPFLDYRNGLLVLSRNTIIYGHNMMTDDLIFGRLEEYTTIKGFKSAPIIEFDTMYKDYKWKIFAVFITNADKEHDNGYVFNYIFTNVRSDSDFEEYIEQLDQRKLYTTGVDIKPSDKILTLSTCSYEFHNARLVVVARMVRQGEEAYVNTSQAKMNPSPRYPQVWYDTYNGGKNPYSSYEKWTLDRFD
ncbi:MAG: class B sortase [Clostridiales bacterium]|jgi:SrtB family sortase|nr:class B sortase [Clostridiales bacterium]